MPTAAMQQEQNRRFAKVANAFCQARDWLDKVTGQLGAARRDKKALRVLELESELTEATAARNKAASEYKSVTGVDAPLSTVPQPRAGTLAALRAANAEFRRLDDEVAQLERERDKLLAQIGPLETTLKKERGAFSFTSTSNPLVDAVISSIYPDVRPNTAGVLHGQKVANMSIELAGLNEEFHKTETQRLEAMRKRDEMFEQLRAAR